MLNIGYIVHLYIINLLLIYISKLKCCEKQDELTYNVVYLFFIYE